MGPAAPLSLPSAQARSFLWINQGKCFAESTWMTLLEPAGISCIEPL
jgi:hypothetical protein